MDLLTDEQRQDLCRGLHRAMFRGSPLARATAGLDLPWQEWVRTAAALRGAAPAADLVRAAGRLAGLATATLDTVLDLLAAGRGGDLASALARDRGDAPGTAPAVLAGTLYALTGHYLVEAGRAEWAASWTGPSRLIAADIEADDLSALVGAAVQRPVTEVARLRLHLASLRLNPAAAGPAASLLQARVRGPAGAGTGPRGPEGNVRITADADPIATRRISTIRVWNVIVGIVAIVFVLIGTHAWGSAHSPAPFPPSLGPLAGRPLLPSGPLASGPAGIGLPTPIAVPPLPSPAFAVPTPSLVTSIVVQPGDSLGALACRYGISVRALQKLNHLGRSTRIAAGQRLTVPAFGLVASC
jgi:hypothetical protein